MEAIKRKKMSLNANKNADKHNFVKGHQLRKIFLVLSISLVVVLSVILLISPLVKQELSGKASGMIVPNIQLTRNTCVAPCSIFFDATTTTGLANNDYVNAEFSWDFADSGSNHPTAEGFVVAHVFETPGTYNVLVNVKDSLGDTASTIIPITVDGFTGTTYCVSASGAVDCPGGTIGLQNFDQVYAEFDVDGEGSNKRFMFKRGERFVMNNAIYLRSTNNIEFSAYGVGEKPKLVPVFLGSGLFEPHSNTFDVRFVDLDLDGEGASMESIYTRSDNLGEFLFLRDEVHNLERGVDFQTHVNMPLYIVDSNFHDFFTNHHIYYHSNYLVLIGSSFINSPTSTASTHNFYLANIYKGYISDNIMGGRQASDILRISNDGRDEGLLGGDVVVSGNTIYTTSDVVIMLHLGPNSAAGCDYTNPASPFYQNCWQLIENVLVEKNKFYYGGGWGQIQIGGDTRNVAIRNNLFETSLPDAHSILFWSHNSDGSLKSGTASEDTSIYHNTFFSHDDGSAIQVSNWATQSEIDNDGTLLGTNGPPIYHTNIDIQNNIFYSDAIGDFDAVGYDLRNGDLILNEISINDNLFYFPNNPGWSSPVSDKDLNQIYADPLFVDPVGASLTVLEDDDLRISLGSPAIDTGVNLQISKDFLGNLRPQGAGNDIGAFEYLAGVQQQTCGNNFLEGTEQCDDGNLIDGDGCSASCLTEIIAPLCGNGIIETGEVCDDINLSIETCQTQGFDFGNLTCSTDCLSFNDINCKFNPVLVIGDVTSARDGVDGSEQNIDINDILVVVDYILLSPLTTTNNEIAAADANCDTIINVLDLIEIVKKILDPQLVLSC